MKTTRTIVVSLAVMAGVITACSGSSGPRTQSVGGSIQVGSSAPDFSLPSADGRTYSLAQFRGKPVLLYFSMGPG